MERKYYAKVANNVIECLISAATVAHTKLMHPDLPSTAFLIKDVAEQYDGDISRLLKSGRPVIEASADKPIYVDVAMPDCCDAGHPKALFRYDEELSAGRYRASEIKAYSLPWSEVTGSKSLVTTSFPKKLLRNGLPKIIFHHDGSVDQSHPLIAALLQQHPTTRVENAFSLSSPYAVNYYHWHLNILLSAFYLQRLGVLDGLQLLIPPLKSWQRASLGALAIGLESALQLDGARFVCDRIIRTTAEDRHGWRKHPLVREMFIAIRSAICNAPQAPSRFIYLSRRDAADRAMINESELETELAKLGFEIISASGMTYEDQVRLFSGARVVVSPHGAGLTNIGFCPPGALIIEIFPRNYLNQAFATLAAVCQHRYGVIISYDHSGSGTQTRWNVDAAKLVEFVYSCMRQNNLL
jgi:hypothetical protein